MIKALWNKLDERQRYLVAGAAVLVLLALILELAIFPFWDAKTKLSKSIQTHQKKLNEIKMLDAEYKAQEGAMTKIKSVMSARGADFSLFAYLEKKATQAGVRGRIKQMTSSKGIKTTSMEESLIDMKLEKITVKQLNDFLYYAESPADLVMVKRITVNKMKESPEYLNAQLLISTFQTLDQKRERTIAK